MFLFLKAPAPRRAVSMKCIPSILAGLSRFLVKVLRRTHINTYLTWRNTTKYGMAFTVAEKRLSRARF